MKLQQEVWEQPRDLRVLGQLVEGSGAQVAFSFIIPGAEKMREETEKSSKPTDQYLALSLVSSVEFWFLGVFFGHGSVDLTSSLLGLWRSELSGN